MTPEEYIDQQCEAFHKTCAEIGFQKDWTYTLGDIALLDEARDLAKAAIWPDGTPEELGNSVAIMWGAMFSKLLAGSYVSKWGVDPKSKTPVVIVKCGTQATQVQAILLGAQAFNQGELFADLAKALSDHLISAGAESL